jgi:hypothetical protein
VWLAFIKCSSVFVSIAEPLRAVAMLEITFELTLIPITVRPNVDSIPRSLRLLPFANVRVILGAFPDSISVFKTSLPLPLINFAIAPLVHPLAIRLVSAEAALIDRAVFIFFEASS